MGIYVEWIDAGTTSSGSPWTDKSDAVDTNLLVKSLGFLLSENEDSITVYAHDTEDEVCGQITIPKCTIKKRLSIAVPQIGIDSN